jgi:RimJ/RimL family protein N-acetyltransferase
MIELSKATPRDFDDLLAFYEDVIAHTPNIVDTAWWIKGQHPSARDIRAYLAEGCMYLYREDGAILSAMAFPMCQGEDYHPVAWAQPLRDDEVAVLHIFAVRPDRQGEGIGAGMVRAALALAWKNGRKAVRLDTLASNTPSQTLYTALGFQYRGQQRRFIENVAWKDFFYYEYLNEAETEK